MLRRDRGFWEAEITEALRALGGRGSLQDIYEWVLANGKLTPRDLKDWGGVGPMYQHTIRGTLTCAMTRKGLVRRVDRGRLSSFLKPVSRKGPKGEGEQR